MLTERSIAESRSMARALVMSGKVYVDDNRVDKPGTLVRQDCKLLIKESRPKYVGRGGLKLEEALKQFKVDVAGYSALDIGASTGGFTDCLLKHGAKKVFIFTRIISLRGKGSAQEGDDFLTKANLSPIIE